MSRPRATDQLQVRIPPEEKDELRRDARKHKITMSALVRISIMSAREHRERDALMQQIYPQSY